MTEITRYKYRKLSLMELCELVYQDTDELQTIDTIEYYIKELVGKNNMVALHLLDAIYNSDCIPQTDFFIYNFANGTLQTPKEVSEKRQLLPFIKFKPRKGKNNENDRL